MDEKEKQGLVIQSVVSRLSTEDRSRLSAWVEKIQEISKSEGSYAARGMQAVRTTLDSKVAWPAIRVLFDELKAHGWSERSMAQRAAMATIVGTVVATGGAGAGIAAMGGAIGVPLWLLTGTGAYALAKLVDELRRK